MPQHVVNNEHQRFFDVISTDQISYDVGCLEV